MRMGKNRGSLLFVVGLVVAAVVLTPLVSRLNTTPAQLAAQGTPALPTAPPFPYTLTPFGTLFATPEEPDLQSSPLPPTLGGPPPITLPSGTLPPTATMDYPGMTMTVAAYPSPNPTYQTPPPLTITPTEYVFPTQVVTLPPVENLVVTKLEDTNDGRCDEDCSLREAVTGAARGATITFASGLKGVIALEGEAIVIARSVTIIGPSPDELALKGNGLGRIVTVRPGVVFTLANLTLTGGVAGSGGGLSNEGARVTLVNLRFVNNSGTSGGAIHNWKGHMTILNTTIEKNQGTTGGGLFNREGEIWAYNTAFINNKAAAGHEIDNYGKIDLINSVVDGSGTPSNGFEVISNSGSIAAYNTIIIGVAGAYFETCRGKPIIGDKSIQFPNADCGSQISVLDPRIVAEHDKGGNFTKYKVELRNSLQNKGDEAQCEKVRRLILQYAGVLKSANSPSQCNIGLLR
jgi:CSLREA domain-containing protein